MARANVAVCAKLPELAWPAGWLSLRPIDGEVGTSWGKSVELRERAGSRPWKRKAACRTTARANTASTWWKDPWEWGAGELGETRRLARSGSAG